MDNNLINYDDWDLMQSNECIAKLYGELPKKSIPMRDDIKYITYNKTIDLNDSLRGNFYYCNFNQIEFNDFDCSDYYFDNCNLTNCKSKNSNFKYMGMISSNINNDMNKNSIKSNSFEHSIIECSKFYKLNLEACSFQNIYINDCIFKNIEITSCDFKGSIIKNCTIDDVKFYDTSFQFVEFENVKVKNSSFLFNDVLHSFYGINMVEQNKNRVFIKFSDKSKQITGNEFIHTLDKIVPYLLSENDFFALANISIYTGNQDDAFNYILNGLKFNLEQKNFESIRYLCKLASLNPLFSKKDLNLFFEALKSDIVSSKLNRFEYVHYTHELSEIKKLLIYNPSKLTQMTITVKSTFYEYDYEKISYILKIIDSTANKIIPQSSKQVSIRHNSPPIFEIVLNNDIVSLLPYFALLCTVFGNSIKYVQKIYELMMKKYELEGQKISNEVKKEELHEKQLSNELKKEEINERKLSSELKKIEIEREKIKNQILLENLDKIKYEYNQKDYEMNGDEISSISYELKSDYIDIPKEFRQMSFKL